MPEDQIRDEYKDNDVSLNHHQLEHSESEEEYNPKKQRKYKQTMETVFKEYHKSYPERYQTRLDYFKAVAESKVLSRFTVETPDNLVECGYNTAHHDARLKKIEMASFFLHTLVLFFSIAFVPTGDAV